MNALHRLKLAPKLLIVAVLLIVPLAVALTVLMLEWQQQVTDAQRFRDVVTYQRAIRETLPGVTGHRSVGVQMALGDQSQAGRIPELESTIETGLAHLKDVDQKLGARFKTEGRVATLVRDWEALKGSYRGMKPLESRDAHQAIAAQLIGLAGQVADTAGVALDDDPRTMFMLDALSFKTLSAANDLSRAKLRAASMAISGKVDPVERDQLIVLITEQKISNHELDDDLRHAVETGDAKVGTLKDTREGFAAASGSFLALMQQVLGGATGPETLKQITEADAGTKKTIYALYDKLSQVAEELLTDRVHRNIEKTVSALAGILALLALALFIGWKVRTALVLQLAQAREAFAKIEGGDFTAPLKVLTEDEAGEVVGALARMQANLKERTEREQRVAAENARVRTALDRVSVGVMLADNDGQIIYCNDAVGEMFRLQLAEVRKALPHFDPERIVGQSFDSFHRSPAHQRNLLAGLRGAHTAEVKLGAATLRITANPVVDAAGQRVGTVVQWLDRTAEVATEAEVETIVSRALEGDLAPRIALAGKSGFFEKLGRGVNSLLDNFSEVVRTITAAAHEVRTGSDEISKGNANLSQRTEEQASSLEETASSMEEMTSTVKSNADSAAQANQLAMAARDQAETGGSVVARAVAAMGEINDSSRKIADIIGVIDEIAFQTNLLALNAAVE
ncbi:MAG: PAS domain-containing protein, partial [Proteobacteria bacterium]|nr:PAS domain-containing protein [Pseudomonadota bacterium]